MSDRHNLGLIRRSLDSKIGSKIGSKISPSLGDWGYNQLIVIINTMRRLDHD
ncbi:hypothetical protein SPLC1_S207810 [Arthrospira platensis C1]|nr:hypothetical protein SPLC1_S207810 [Arthrospira platensis C1]